MLGFRPVYGGTAKDPMGDRCPTARFRGGNGGGAAADRVGGGEICAGGIAFWRSSSRFLPILDTNGYIPGKV